jgi:hypothetical protein
MAYRVSKFDVWVAEIDDRVGGLDAALEPLADAGADLAFVVARRQPDKPGKGVVFVGGVSGSKASKAAAAGGLAKSSDLVALRVEETNKPGSCHKMTHMLADAGINLRGLSASVVGSKCVYIIAFDSASDADRAAKVLRGPGKRK